VPIAEGKYTPVVLQYVAQCKAALFNMVTQGAFHSVAIPGDVADGAVRDQDAQGRNVPVLAFDTFSRPLFFNREFGLLVARELDDIVGVPSFVDQLVPEYRELAIYVHGMASTDVYVDQYWMPCALSHAAGFSIPACSPRRGAHPALALFGGG
jgi:hypothetical protein